MGDLVYAILRALFGVFGAERVIVDAWSSILDFLVMGGNVLFLIGLLLLVMWLLIFERLFYLYSGHRKMVRAVIEAWEQRSERRSWEARRIRDLMISEVRVKLESTLGLIAACVALAPLLGLLGTVTGMIEVFQVMAIAGSGNPRMMAGGVSKATIPTMGGMVAALSGLFISVWLNRKAASEVELLGEHLTMETEPGSA